MSDSESDPDYVHVQFHDPDRLEAIRNTKNQHNMRWREVLEYGARYLQAIDDVIDDNPELLAQHLLKRTDTTELLEYANRDDLTDSVSTPKRDPDTPDSGP